LQFANVGVPESKSGACRRRGTYVPHSGFALNLNKSQIAASVKVLTLRTPGQQLFHVLELLANVALQVQLYLHPADRRTDAWQDGADKPYNLVGIL